MKDFIIKNIDTYLYEFCERYDIDDEDNFLEVLCGDPDYVKIDNEIAAYFIVDEQSKAIWVYIIESEEAAIYAINLFKDGKAHHIQPNSWEHFDLTRNGIAFRNYNGYYYTLYAIL